MMATPPVIIACGATYGAYLERVSKATQDTLAGATDSASESIAGLRTVRAFASEESRLVTYVASVERSYRLGVQVSLAGGVFGAVMSAVVSCAIGGILYFGAGLVVAVRPAPPPPPPPPLSVSAVGQDPAQEIRRAAVATQHRGGSACRGR